ncbi:MAG: calcium:proton antiporter [Helicobacteraceae bacterium]|nr:calcium:proton antiporter [Helicobacteraceae bacterium]
MKKILEEKALAISIFTAILYMLFGNSWLSNLENTPVILGQFIIVFGIMLVSSFGVVKHADMLAIKLGEPYGTLILTLAVISIEVVAIVAVMLTGKYNPTLGRDMMFSVIMIVLNGLIGISLLVGGIKHIQQQYNLQGTNTYLSMIAILVIVSMVLPNYTQATEAGTFSHSQTIFIIIITLGLYLLFLFMQSLRHRDFFMAPTSSNDKVLHDASNFVSIGYHSVLLVLYMLPIVILSKKLAIMINHGITSADLPVALGGLLVAILVLAPEGVASVKAALANQIQRSINICLGSALATISLTVPAILIIGLITSKTIVLGLNGVDIVMLLTTLFVSVINLSSGKSNVIQGSIHFILFALYLLLLFDKCTTGC